MTVTGLTQPLYYLPALLADQFSLARSEIRRLLATGGVRINGSIYHDHEARGNVLAGAELRVGNRLAQLPDAEDLKADYRHALIHPGLER